MNCCEKCFNDIEIQDIIKGKEKGNCDFCNGKNVYICDVSKNEDLKENFERLLEIYTPISNLNDTFPKDKSDMIKNILSNEWSIFKLKPREIYKFICALLPHKYKEESSLFDSPVGIKGSIEEDYLNQYSILGIYSWDDFVTEIKYSNRFHTSIVNTDILEKLLNVCYRTYKPGHYFYRARIWNNSNGYILKDMGAPPSKNARAGRANSEGISCLYLANSEKTTLHETRAGLYDCATVGKFILKEEIKIVDLSNIDKLSPFSMDNIDLLAANLENLRKIGDEVSRPLRKHDSSLDYLPTQYICDYIKNLGFNGIQYKSTMCTGGVNFAIFEQEKLECVETVDYDIGSINYGFKTIDD